jgi:hypothetical protein
MTLKMNQVKVREEQPREADASRSRECEGDGEIRGIYADAGCDRRLLM